jgi:hypothetical protein
LAVSQNADSKEENNEKISQQRLGFSESCKRKKGRGGAKCQVDVEKVA